MCKLKFSYFRLGAKGALNHPYFWDLHKKSDFLRDVHHWCKTKVPTAWELHVMQCLRNIESRVFSNSDWTTSMTPAVAGYLLPSSRVRRVKYEYDNILHLIRAFRNLIAHRKDVPPIVIRVSVLMFMLSLLLRLILLSFCLRKRKFCIFSFLCSQEFNGDLQTDIYQYFETRFPELLIQVYQVINRECRQEDTFRMYFSD